MADANFEEGGEGVQPKCEILTSRIYRGRYARYLD